MQSCAQQRQKRRAIGALASTMLKLRGQNVHWVQKACKCKNFTFWLFTHFGTFRLWRTLWCRNYVDIRLSYFCRITTRVITIHQRYRQTYGQTTYHGNTALRYASRAKNTADRTQLSNNVRKEKYKKKIKSQVTRKPVWKSIGVFVQ